jgi:hypothetical protein
MIEHRSSISASRFVELPHTVTLDGEPNVTARPRKVPPELRSLLIVCDNHNQPIHSARLTENHVGKRNSKGFPVPSRPSHAKPERRFDMVNEPIDQPRLTRASRKSSRVFSA